MASVLLVEPYNLIFKHQELVNSFCFALEAHDFKVSRLSCQGMMKNNCLAHQYLNVTVTTSEIVKQKICGSCNSAGQTRNIVLPFPEFFLEDFLTPANFAEIDQAISDYDRRRDPETQIDKIPIGNFAMYETILRFKLLNPDTAFLNPIEPFYRATLLNCLFTYFGVSNILEMNTFDYIVVYNSLYSFNQTIFEVSKKKKHCFVSLHASNNPKKPYSRVMLSSGGPAISEALIEWRKQTKSAPRFSVDVLTRNYLRNLKYGKQAWHYSQPKSTIDENSTLEFLREIAQHKKLILVPLSSSDEVNAHNFALSRSSEGDSPRPYPSQESFVWDIIQFANENPHLHFIIRLHPRLFANRREKLDSIEGLMLTNLLHKLGSNSSNITVDNGANIAIQDLLEISDAVVNYVSSVGLDSMLMKIPTLSIYQGESVPVSYPTNLSEVVYSREQLSKKILDTLNVGNSRPENARQWLYFLLKTHSLRIPTFPFSPTLFLWRLLAFKLKRVEVGSILFFSIQTIRKNEQRLYKFFGLYRGLKLKLLEMSFCDESKLS